MNEAYKKRKSKLLKIVKGKEAEILKAIRSGDHVLAESLIFAGNDPQTQKILEEELRAETKWRENKAEGKLFAAVERGDIDIIKALIESGVSINTKHPKSGATPLMLALFVFKSLPWIKVFHKNGGDINIENNNGETALDFAYYLECTDIINYLCENGGKRGSRYINDSR